MSKIALKMYGDRKFWRKIYADNKDVLKNPNRIYVGQKLTLYFDLDETQNQSDADATVKANTYVIKPGDTLWDITKKFYTTTEKIRELNDLKTENLTPMQQLLVERV